MTRDLTDDPNWRPLSFSLEPRELDALISLASESARLDLRGPAGPEEASSLESLRGSCLAELSAPSAALHAALHVVTDLLKQGRGVRVRSGGGLEFEATIVVDSESPGGARDALKTLRRGQLLVERTNQLREGSVREFVKSMERKRLHGHRFTSIFSVMRDGRELARELARVRGAHEDLDARARALGEVVAPYLQFIEGDEVCEHTGLRLRDMWRYFRHTWATVYRSVPGRSMMILIRDAAAPKHPVIGVAALSSPAMQLRQRDLWIGWHPECAPGAPPSDEATSLLGEQAQTAVWLRDVVARALGEVYIDDFVEEGVLAPGDLSDPPSELIEWLGGEVGRQRIKHRRHAASEDYKRAAGMSWEERARTHLYRSKRAEALTWLLEARVRLASLPEDPSDDEVSAWLEDSANAGAAKKVLRKAKADMVGVSVADISVCGAVPPYNALLGGKLVCMLLTSPEVRGAYRRRYEDAQSVIASSVAGRDITRAAELVLLGTTSLYGRSSQYNRVRVPASALGLGSGRVCFEELGVTEGYGTHQFGDETVEALSALVSQRNGGQRVNSIFGEGTSPRLRKIRAGLEELGLSSGDLLQHGAQRAMYVVPLAENLKEYLLGLEGTPRYIIGGPPAEATAAIAGWWRRRWLSKRVRLDEVLAETRRHTLVHPIQHGARVVLPQLDADQQTLFDPYE